MDKRSLELQQQFGNLWGRVALFVATGAGVGYFPVMPGTLGSLWGLPLVWWQHQLDPADGGSTVVHVLSGLALVLLSIPICSKAAVQLNRPDPPAVVLDEIAAFPLVFLAVSLDLTSGFWGFLWFRAFDIAKPWPIRQVEKLPGGYGIVCDDVVAALYAAAALWGTVRLLELA